MCLQYLLDINIFETLLKAHKCTSGIGKHLIQVMSINQKFPIYVFSFFLFTITESYRAKAGYSLHFITQTQENSGQKYLISCYMHNQ